MVMSDPGKCLLDIIGDPSALEEFFEKKNGPSSSEPQVNNSFLSSLSTSSRGSVPASVYHAGMAMLTRSGSDQSAAASAAAPLHSLVPSVVTSINEGPYTSSPSSTKQFPNIQPKTLLHSGLQSTSAILQPASTMAMAPSGLPGKHVGMQSQNVVNIMPKQPLQQQQQTAMALSGGNIIIAQPGMQQFMINGQPVRLQFVQTPMIQTASGQRFLIPYTPSAQAVAGQPAFSLIPGSQQLSMQAAPATTATASSISGLRQGTATVGQPINLVALTNQTAGCASGTAPSHGNMISLNALPQNIIQLHLPVSTNTASGQAPTYIYTPVVSSATAVSTSAQGLRQQTAAGAAQATSALSVAAASQQGTQQSSAFGTMYGSCLLAAGKAASEAAAAAAVAAAADGGWQQVSVGGNTAETASAALQQGDQRTQLLYEKALKLQRAQQMTGGVVNSMAPVSTSNSSGLKLAGTLVNSGDKAMAATPAVQVQQHAMVPGTITVNQQTQQMLLKIQSHINLLKNLTTLSEEQSNNLQQLQNLQQQIFAQLKQGLQQQQQQQLLMQQAQLSTPGVVVSGATNQSQPVHTTQMLYITGGVQQMPVAQEAPQSAGNVAALIAALKTIKAGNQTYSIQLTDEQQRSIADQLVKMAPEQQKEFIKRQQTQFVMTALNRQRLLQQASEGSGGTSALASPAQVQAMLPPAQAPAAPVDRITSRLRQDQMAALKPDTRTPFENTAEACKKLLRYHVYQHSSPDVREFVKVDSVFEKFSFGALQKQSTMTDKLRELLWKASIAQCPVSERVLVSKLLLEDERQQITADRALALHNPERFRELYRRSWVHPRDEASESSWPATDLKAELKQLRSEPSDEEEDDERDSEIKVVDDPPIDSYPESQSAERRFSEVMAGSHFGDTSYCQDIETKPKVKVKEELLTSSSPLRESGHRSSTPLPESSLPKQSKCAIFSETIKSEQIADISFDNESALPYNVALQNGTASLIPLRINKRSHHCESSNALDVTPPIKMRIMKQKAESGHSAVMDEDFVFSQTDSTDEEEEEDEVSSKGESEHFETNIVDAAQQSHEGAEDDEAEGEESVDGEDVDVEACYESSGEDRAVQETMMPAEANSQLSMHVSQDTPMDVDCEDANDISKLQLDPVHMQQNGDVFCASQEMYVTEDAIQEGIDTKDERSRAALFGSDEVITADSDNRESFHRFVDSSKEAFGFDSLLYEGSGMDSAKLENVMNTLPDGTVTAAAASSGLFPVAASDDLYNDVTFDEIHCDDELQSALESIMS